MCHTQIIKNKSTDLSSVKHSYVYSSTENFSCTEEGAIMSLKCIRKSRLHLLTQQYRGAVPLIPASLFALYPCVYPPSYAFAHYKCLMQ